MKPMRQARQRPRCHLVIDDREGSIGAHNERSATLHPSYAAGYSPDHRHVSLGPEDPHLVFATRSESARVGTGDGTNEIMHLTCRHVGPSDTTVFALALQPIARLSLVLRLLRKRPVFHGIDNVWNELAK